MLPESQRLYTDAIRDEAARRGDVNLWHQNVLRHPTT
jgi:hypothetical protein